MCLRVTPWVFTEIFALADIYAWYAMTKYVWGKLGSGMLVPRPDRLQHPLRHRPIRAPHPPRRPRPVYGPPRLSLHRDRPLLLRSRDRRRIRLRRPQRHHKRQARVDLRARDRPGGHTDWSAYDLRARSA